MERIGSYGFEWETAWAVEKAELSVLVYNLFDKTWNRSSIA